MSLLKNFVSGVSDVFTSSTQSCPAFVENLQNLTIIDAKGNVIIENVHWDQMSTVKSACLNSNIANVDSKSKIQVLQKKFVKTVMTNFPGLILTDVQNLTSEVVSNMTTLFQQNCAVHVLNQQKVYLRNVKNVVFTYVQWDQTIAAILQCVQSKVYGTDAYQSLARMLGEVVPPPPPPVPVPTPDDGLNFAELLQTWGWVLVPVAVGYQSRIRKDGHQNEQHAHGSLLWVGRGVIRCRGFSTQQTPTFT
jgi:hypothetical protein